ncbi:MAG: hypothetical protein AB7T63_01945 [Planctomycetota bacterium]
MSATSDPTPLPPEDDERPQKSGGMQWVVQASGGSLGERDEPRLSRGAPGDLVQAFRLNAEALHRLEALQGELARAVQRSDRSELVLQSTQALNETFRGLATIQRSLLERLEAAPAAKRSRLVPLAVLGLLLVLVGGIVALTEAIRRNGEVGRINTTEIAREVRSSFEAGHAEGRAARERDIERLEAEADVARKRSQEAGALLDEKLDELALAQRARRVLEGENEDLAQRVARGQEAAVARELLAREVERLERERMAHDTVVQRLEKEISELRNTTLDLRTRLGDRALGISSGDDDDDGSRPAGVPNVIVADPGPPQPDTADGTAPGADEGATEVPPPEQPVLTGDDPWAVRDLGPLPSEPKEDAPLLVPPGTPSAPEVRPAPPPAPPPTSDMPPPIVRRRDGGDEDVSLDGPRAVPPAGSAPVVPEVAAPRDAPPSSILVTQGARNGINGLLQRARGPGRGWFQVTGVDRVDGGAVSGLTLVRYDTQGNADDIFRARDARVVVDRASGEVGLVLRDGIRHGARTGTQDLPPQGLRIVVARAPDLVDAWAASGWSFVAVR